MLKKFEAKTPEGQEFYDLLESLSVNVEYGKQPNEKAQYDYFIALEVWMRNHKKLPEEITKSFTFTFWTLILDHASDNKNAKLTNYADQERKKIGTFENWAEEANRMNGNCFKQARFNYALNTAIAMGNMQQLKGLVKNDRIFGFGNDSKRNEVLTRIAYLTKKS